jgi:hypothetical protein
VVSRKKLCACWYCLLVLSVEHTHLYFTCFYTRFFKNLRVHGVNITTHTAHVSRHSMWLHFSRLQCHWRISELIQLWPQNVKALLLLRVLCIGAQISLGCRACIWALLTCVLSTHPIAFMLGQIADWTLCVVIFLTAKPHTLSYDRGLCETNLGLLWHCTRRPHELGVPVFGKLE